MRSRQHGRVGLRYLVLLAVALAAGSADVVRGQLTVVDPGQGRVALSSGTTAAAELSGIAWTGGANYLAVGDNGAKSLWRLSVTVDASSGWISSGTVVGAVPAPGLGTDSEGIAYRSATGSVFVSDEVASSITQFDATTGATLGGVAVPAIYAPANVQSNMGLESLAFGPGGLWTANEEAVVPDGPLSTTTQGSWVRIQRFDATLAAAGQWGYRTDPISALTSLTTAERSGVVDVLPWTSTTLLVLEREFGGAVIPDFRSRLYGVDLATGSDVAAVASLSTGSFTPLAKTLLWEGSFGTSNFEGMTFGPTLASGFTSLLLISDNGGGINQDLYALQVVPEPAFHAAAAGVAIGISLAAGRSRRRRLPHSKTAGYDEREFLSSVTGFDGQSVVPRLSLG